MIFVSYKENRFMNFIVGFAQIFDGLLSILTLGFIGSSLTFKILAHLELSKLKKKKEKNTK